MLLGLIAAGAFALAGCGGGAGAEEVLGETADNLGEIRSGVLDMTLMIEPQEGDAFGFEVRGPFALARDGGLPELDVEYTQIANGERETVGLLSDGRTAYAVVGDERLELSAEQVASLRGAGAAVDGGAGLDQLAVDDWIDDAEVSDGGTVGGAETDRVRGRLDVVEAVNGLLELARSFGRDLPQIEGNDAEQLRDAVRSTLLEVYTGKDDRLLRRLRLEADFGLDVPTELQAALGDVVGAKVTFRLGIDDPNRPVDVKVDE